MSYVGPSVYFVWPLSDGMSTRVRYVGACPSVVTRLSSASGVCVGLSAYRPPVVRLWVSGGNPDTVADLAASHAFADDPVFREQTRELLS